MKKWKLFSLLMTFVSAGFFISSTFVSNPCAYRNNGWLVGDPSDGSKVWICLDKKVSNSFIYCPADTPYFDELGQRCSSESYGGKNHVSLPFVCQLPWKNFCVYACADMLDPNRNILQYAHLIQHGDFNSTNSLNDEGVSVSQRDDVFEYCTYIPAAGGLQGINIIDENINFFNKGVVLIENEGINTAHASIIVSCENDPTLGLNCVLNDPKYGAPIGRIITRYDIGSLYVY